MIKTLKHEVFNLYRKYVWLISYIGKKAHTNIPTKRGELYIITIAYNQVRLIEKQIEQVKRYIKDKSYQYAVVDNSPEKNIRKQIKNVCEREQVEYVSVPFYIDRLICHRIFGYGLSHGAALNWMLYHYLMPRCPKHFVLLDHDVFPMEDFSFVDKIGERDFYGVERIRESGWYLWPGWCIFKYDVIAKRKPNFLPYFFHGTFLDAGGGNYPYFYGQYDLKTIDFPTVTTKRIRCSKSMKAYDDIYHGDCVQLIDDVWLHFINGSNYAKIPGKEKLVDKMIDNIEKLYEEMKRQ